MPQVTVKTQVTSPPTILGDTLENGCTALPEVACSLMHETNALITSIKKKPATFLFWYLLLPVRSAKPTDSLLRHNFCLRHPSETISLRPLCCLHIHGTKIPAIFCKTTCSFKATWFKKSNLHEYNSSKNLGDAVDATYHFPKFSEKKLKCTQSQYTRIQLQIALVSFHAK